MEPPPRKSHRSPSSDKKRSPSSDKKRKRHQTPSSQTKEPRASDNNGVEVVNEQDIHRMENDMHLVSIVMATQRVPNQPRPYGLFGRQDILQSIRRLRDKPTNNTTNNNDSVALSFTPSQILNEIYQYKLILEDARQMDRARKLSEETQELEKAAKRQQEKERLENASFQEWEAHYSSSWLLTKCASVLEPLAEKHPGRRHLQRLLELEDKSRRFYAREASYYFQFTVCPSLTRLDSNVEDLLSFVQTENKKIQHALLQRSSKWGSVPKLFLEAYEAHKQEQNDDDDDEIVVVKVIKASRAPTCSSTKDSTVQLE